MNEINFFDKLLADSVNAMTSPDWEWPADWTSTKKSSFLSASIRYAEQAELYEQCIILKKIQDRLRT